MHQIVQEVLMADELSQEQLNSISASFGEKIQSLIDSEPSLSGYQIEELEMVKRDGSEKGLTAGCKVECKVSGFPPKVKCKLVCET